LVLSLDAPRSTGRAVPGHNRWHPDIPAVAEVITGGSVRLECEAASDVMCGPIVVVGAEPGDVIVVDVLGVGRSDGIYSASGHPGVIGCAPALPAASGDGADPEDALLGWVRPGDAAYGRMAAEALSTEMRGRDIGGCAIAPLTGGSRILLPVEVHGAKLSAGDLHFPARGEECRGAERAGWIDLRVNLTRKGVERFRVTGPMLMP
jgi:formamidase